MENKQKTVSSQVMELKDLISGPLVATIDADTISSRRYLKYLFELAFESYDEESGEVGDMRTLNFTYMSRDINGARMQRVSIPLLTLVPLPLLQVKEADFDFDIQIIDAVSQDAGATFSLKNAMEGKEEPLSGEGTKLRVSLSPASVDASSKSSVQQSLTANMRVKVKMRQADLPGGVANLLNLTTNNLMIEDTEDDETKNIKEKGDEKQ